MARTRWMIVFAACALVLSLTGCGTVHAMRPLSSPGHAKYKPTTQERPPQTGDLFGMGE